MFEQQKISELRWKFLQDTSQDNIGKILCTPVQKTGKQQDLRDNMVQVQKNMVESVQMNNLVHKGNSDWNTKAILSRQWYRLRSYDGCMLCRVYIIKPSQLGETILSFPCWEDGDHSSNPHFQKGGEQTFFINPKKMGMEKLMNDRGVLLIANAVNVVNFLVGAWQM